MAMLSIESLIETTRSIRKVSQKAAEEYEILCPKLIESVDCNLSQNKNVISLIGSNHLQKMLDNHKNHAAFMTSVFSLNNFELLSRTVLWVYKTYSNHGFSFEYFPIELKAWKVAVEQLFPIELKDEILDVYNWMIAHHEDFVDLARSPLIQSSCTNGRWSSCKNELMRFLLKADHLGSLNLAKGSVHSIADLEEFYIHVLQQAMYEIGCLWERGEISVAQEHLTSAIVNRVMAWLAQLDFKSCPNNKRAIVTACSNEFHELGAWMIADILEYDGWTVRYLGANTPVQDVLNLSYEFKPNILAVSVTMPFNLTVVQQMIFQIKNQEALKDTKIMVGGRSFNENPKLWERIGANGFANDVIEAKKLAREWFLL